jgi:site-specific recombinase XerD
MKIEIICKLCIETLINAGFLESTIFNYQGVIRRFKVFCKEKNVTEYSLQLGQLYANDVISKKTGKFSKGRFYLQGRFIRLLDSYIKTGVFNLSIKTTGKIKPNNPKHKIIYENYYSYLTKNYQNINTIHFYEYGMYCLLHYLDKISIESLNELTSKIIICYIQESKPNRQREILCELRNIFRYLSRKDLDNAIAGIHVARHKRIIPTLTNDEITKIKFVINNNIVSLRNAAMVLMGMNYGIRACDIIKLRLSDINWENETISFKQSKTGNLVCLPLTVSVGNALFKYITLERPNAPNNFVFIRQIAPFNPFSEHSACYYIVSKVFKKAGIEKGSNIWGMHMLRHNAASTMVKNEVSIETIAAILGHSSPDTTDIYITTDEKKLMSCILPMIGISKEVFHE